MNPLDRQSLIAAMDAGATFSFVPFWGHTPRDDGRLSDACFSQWWRADFVVAGVRYATAEQFMMAEKARTCGDAETLEEILREQDPTKVKALGRRVRGYDDAKWSARRFDAVTEGSLAKFSTTPELRAYLLDTGDAVLVEASPTDQLWGIGLGRESPFVRQPREWRGENLLGFALMRARALIRGRA